MPRDGTGMVDDGFRKRCRIMDAIWIVNIVCCRVLRGVASCCKALQDIVRTDVLRCCEVLQNVVRLKEVVRCKLVLRDPSIESLRTNGQTKIHDR